jgi:hypothetical protein
MQKLFVGTLIAAVILDCCPIPGLAQNSFKPAEVTSTPYIQSLPLSGSPSVVILDISLDNEGVVTGVTVVRGLVFLASVATSSIHTWKFTPASTQGVPEASVFRVAFVFLPHGFTAVGPGSPPKHSEGDPDRNENQGYIPPEIVSVAYPNIRSTLWHPVGWSSRSKSMRTAPLDTWMLCVTCALLPSSR